MLDELFGGPVAANDNGRSCERCGDSFTGRSEKRYCSEQCRRKSADARYKTGIESTCEQCSTAFMPKRTDRLRFCSRRCAFDNFSDRATIAAPVSFTVARRICKVCRSKFTAKTTATICSDACRAVCTAAKTREKKVANDNLDRSPRACHECATIFTAHYGDKRSVYCSSGCSRRSIRRVRRQIERARLIAATVENVNPNKVFDRDKWKCQICGCKTPRSKRGTYDDNAPELDHIMPLSLGGAHSYLNTQCACRKCNSAKGNTPPTQPSLFAYVA